MPLCTYFCLFPFVDSRFMFLFSFCWLLPVYHYHVAILYTAQQMFLSIIIFFTNFIGISIKISHRKYQKSDWNGSAGFDGNFFIPFCVCKCKFDDKNDKRVYLYLYWHRQLQAEMGAVRRQWRLQNQIIVTYILFFSVIYDPQQIFPRQTKRFTLKQSLQTTSSTDINNDFAFSQKLFRIFCFSLFSNVCYIMRCIFQSFSVTCLSKIFKYSLFVRGTYQFIGWLSFRMFFYKIVWWKLSCCA